MPSDTVAILLCTYNGQAFIHQQLASFEQQAFKDWVVYASDDGSSDGTVSTLSHFKSRLPEGKVHISQGPREGFAANFLQLLRTEALNTQYFAYSDQDDEWESDKLSRALSFLRSVPDSVPALYCSRTKLIDPKGQGIGLSPNRPKSPGLANALIENIASGNTMVFNRAARQLICEASNHTLPAAHDWFTYVVVSACGGHIQFDEYPTVRYRQHANNLKGVGTGFVSRLNSIRSLSQGHFRSHIDRHLEGLRDIWGHIPDDNRSLLTNFSTIREQGLSQRLSGFRKLRLYRQTTLGHFGLWYGIGLKKI